MNLICIDFDKTLIDIHTYDHLTKKWIGPKTNENILIVNGNVESKDLNENYDKDKVTTIAKELLDKSNFKDNKDKIKNTFETLLSKGNKIAITSFNKYPEVIELFLNELGLNDQQKDSINIICGFPSNMEEHRKIKHIEKAKELSKIENNANVILLDDDITNINKAEQKGIRGALVGTNFNWSNAVVIVEAKFAAGPLVVAPKAISSNDNATISRGTFQLGPPPRRKPKMPSLPPR